jgi:hypothetical protein
MAPRAVIDLTLTADESDVKRPRIGDNIQKKVQEDDCCVCDGLPSPVATTHVVAEDVDNDDRQQTDEDIEWWNPPWERTYSQHATVNPVTTDCFWDSNPLDRCATFCSVSRFLRIEVGVVVDTSRTRAAEGVYFSMKIIRVRTAGMGHAYWDDRGAYATTTSTYNIADHVDVKNVKTLSIKRIIHPVYDKSSIMTCTYGVYVASLAQLCQGMRTASSQPPLTELEMNALRRIKPQLIGLPQGFEALFGAIVEHMGWLAECEAMNIFTMCQLRLAWHQIDPHYHQCSSKTSSTFEKLRQLAQHRAFCLECFTDESKLPHAAYR